MARHVPLFAPGAVAIGSADDPDNFKPPAVREDTLAAPHDCAPLQQSFAVATLSCRRPPELCVQGRRWMWIRTCQKSNRPATGSDGSTLVSGSRSPPCHYDSVPMKYRSASQLHDALFGAGWFVPLDLCLTSSPRFPILSRSERLIWWRSRRTREGNATPRAAQANRLASQGKRDIGHLAVGQSLCC